MPDGTNLGALAPDATVDKRFRQRLVSPLLRRILLVNALPLALLVATLLYLDQYQNGLLQATVTALREQARIYAGANLGRAGFKDDARVQFNWLLKNVKDPEKLETIRREMQKL